MSNLILEGDFGRVKSTGELVEITYRGYDTMVGGGYVTIRPVFGGREQNFWLDNVEGPFTEMEVLALARGQPAGGS